MATTELLPNGNVRIRVDYVFKKYGCRRRIMLQSEDAGNLTEPVDIAVLNSIARARRWQQYIDEGRFRNMQELADKLKFNRSYVARIIRLNNLSPKIVRLFLAGKAPEGLSLTKLLQHIPEDWNEQDVEFGVAG